MYRKDETEKNNAAARYGTLVILRRLSYQFLLLLSSSFSSVVRKSGINSGSFIHKKRFRIDKQHFLLIL